MRSLVYSTLTGGLIGSSRAAAVLYREIALAWQALFPEQNSQRLSLTDESGNSYSQWHIRI